MSQEFICLSGVILSPGRFPGLCWVGLIPWEGTLCTQSMAWTVASQCGRYQAAPSKDIFPKK